ncbi:MAG: nitrophenyl compound nitroreductase subunit ArsF family protein [Phycisphaerae bacterium]|nr:nitrophenyl compound nitroreductase subunit ArsF family protein [Phycisphaerae bacterium]
MTPKTVTILFFVLAAIISGCKDNATSIPVDQIKNNPIEANKSSEENNPVDTDVKPDEGYSTVIAYYFHRTIRCPGCLEIEAAAQRVIETRFENQIANEKLMWIPLNLDEPGSEEFEKEFDVSVSTLVIAKVQDGNHTNYKKLEKVWDFIGDPVKFDEYVQTEVKEFLNE